MELVKFFATLDFVFAKTMPEQPHEYVVRTSENEAAYVRLFEAVKSRGSWEKFGRHRYRYWLPGDGFKYWATSRRSGLAASSTERGSSRTTGWPARRQPS